MATNLRQLYLNLSQRLVNAGSAEPREIVWRNPKTKEVRTKSEAAIDWEGDACNVEIGFAFEFVTTGAGDVDVRSAVFVPLSIKQDETAEHVMSVDGTEIKPHGNEASEATAAVARHAQKQLEKLFG